MVTKPSYECYTLGMDEKAFLAIVAGDLLDMALNKEANFDHTPSVREFIVKYTEVSND